MRRRHHSFTVDVDIDLCDLDDDMLVDELKDRGYTIIDGGKGEGQALPPAAAERAYYALNDAVPPPVREFVLDAAGRVS